MKRLQISLTIRKTKKVERLKARNEELEEILKYCERIIPIADKRKSSGPIVLFEKIFQHACAMHNALVRNWRCSSRTCRTHQANLCLQAETKNISFNVLFVFEPERESFSEARKQEVVIRPVKEDAGPVAPTEKIRYVQRTDSFTAVQESFIDMNLDGKSSTFSRLLRERRKATSLFCHLGTEKALLKAGNGLILQRQHQQLL